MLSVVLLTACFADNISTSYSDENSGTQQPISEATVSEDAPLESPETEPIYEFLLPDVEHPYKFEMIELLTEYSSQALFPEFEDVRSMDFNERFTTNLMWLTSLYAGNYFSDRNVSEEEDFPFASELRFLNQGLSYEERLTLSEQFTGIPHSGMIVHRSNMTTIGRWFFGKDFYFPKDVITDETAPLDPGGEFYHVVRGRGGVWCVFRYLLLDVKDESRYIAASFLPHMVYFDWENPMEEGTAITWINFLNPHGEAEYSIDFDNWLESPVYLTPIQNFSDYLENVGLPVPQDQLGTLTVTFQIQDDGRLIAVSSRYGNSPVS